MLALHNFISSLIARTRADEAQTMAEYGLLLAVIALIVVAAAIFLGHSISSFFLGVGSSL